jgi:sugar lactone lactonase YvrE
MATPLARRRRFPRLRFDALEPRETPAATQVIDFAAGFTPDLLPGGIPAGYDSRDLVLTDGPYQARAVFAPTRVDVRAFHTSFTFRVEGPAGPLGDGFTFALTGDDTQAAQTAGGTAGGGLGYQGLTDSVAVKFDLVDNAGEGSDSVGLFTGGADPTAPAVRLDGTGIDLHSGHLYQADLAYDGGILALTLRDFTDADIPAWTYAFTVDIPAAVGATTAHAGFTAGTGALFARQAIESWTYTEGPEAPGNRPPAIKSPARASWLSPGSVTLDVDATDDGGPGNLTYAWELVSAGLGAPPEIRPLAGTTSAIVTLLSAYQHTFRVTVTDAGGLTATSEVSYTNSGYFPDFKVFVAPDRVRAGESVQFLTLVPGPGPGGLIAVNLAPTWRVVRGPGTIDASGKYTAPFDATGPVTVRAEIPAFAADGQFSPRAVDTTLTIVGALDLVPLAKSGSAQVTAGRLRLTDGPHQTGGASALTPVDVRGFTTSFWFRVGERLDSFYGDGLTFVLQNAGPAALGRAGSGLGYEGIPRSVAVKFDLVDNAGEGPQSVGVFTGGATPTVPADRLPAPPPGQGNGGLILNTAHVFRADLTYAAGVLTLRLWDTVTGHGAAWRYAVDIPAAVGGPTALAGFTAGTGERFAPIDILKWTFTPTDHPEPPPPADDGAPSITVDAAATVIGTGAITTVAGTGVGGYAGDGGPAAGAALSSPQGVAVDPAGNVYITDYGNNRLRRVDVATGVITTVAGIGTYGSSGDGGPAASAALGNPVGVAVDAAGNLFVADYGNSRVRRVDAATGVITTLAGTGVEGFGGDGGPATGASLRFPQAVAVDVAGNLFVADTGNDRVRRVDAATGVITTVAGNGLEGYSGDGGPATGAAVDLPSGVAVDAAGNLFIADQANQRVRRVDAATGVITTVAGTGTPTDGGDGGPATGASLRNPAGVTVDAAGNLFIADRGNSRVRRVDAATGVITTVAGTGVAGYGGDGGPPTAAILSAPRAVAVDAMGNLFIADYADHRVRKAAAAPPEGTPVTYTFTVTNTSPARTDPVTVTSVADDRLGELIDAARAANGGADVVLAPGQSFTFSATDPVSGPGTVTVTAHDDEGTTATATDARP